MSDDKSQEDKHIKISDVKDTLEWLRDVKTNIEKDKGVNRDTVASLESHFEDTSEELGPNNGFTTAISTVGLPSVQEFVTDKLVATLNELSSTIASEINGIIKTWRDDKEEIIKVSEFLQNNFTFSSDTETVAPNTVTRLLELIADPKANDFFEVFLKDLTNNSNIIARNLRELSNKHPSKPTELFPLESSSGKTFEALYDSYGDEKPYADNFITTVYMFMEMLTTISREKNQSELQVSDLTVAVRRFSSLLVDTFPDTFLSDLESLHLSAKCGFKLSNEPDANGVLVPFTPAEVTNDLTQMEKVALDIRETLSYVSFISSLRQVIFVSLKACMTLN